MVHSTLLSHLPYSLFNDNVRVAFPFFLTITYKSIPRTESANLSVLNLVSVASITDSSLDVIFMLSTYHFTISLFRASPDLSSLLFLKLSTTLCSSPLAFSFLFPEIFKNIFGNFTLTAVDTLSPSEETA